VRPRRLIGASGRPLNFTVRGQFFMRVAILGNSGSGKSTVATWLAARSGAARLALDMVAWVPGEIAVARAASQAQADVRTFCSNHDQWVVEGCYTSLIQQAMAFKPLLLFLNPGVDHCIANCQARPWEPHKYRSKQEQDERLDLLLAWVREYYSRDGDMSLVAHRATFASYSGPKQEVTDVPGLDPPSAVALGWLN
jgi:adenylate kinase family enzyme